MSEPPTLREYCAKHYPNLLPLIEEWEAIMAEHVSVADDLSYLQQLARTAHALGYNPNDKASWPGKVWSLTEARKVRGEEWYLKEIAKLTTAPSRCRWCGHSNP